MGAFTRRAHKWSTHFPSGRLINKLEKKTIYTSKGKYNVLKSLEIYLCEIKHIGLEFEFDKIIILFTEITPPLHAHTVFILFIFLNKTKKFYIVLHFPFVPSITLSLVIYRS